MNTNEIIRQLELLAFAITAGLEMEVRDISAINAAIEYIQQHEQIVRLNEQMAQED